MDASPSLWDHCLDYAALSDIGQRRLNNQDSYAIVLAGSQDDFQRRGHFFMVADGMGAHAAGELASKMAADIVSLVYRKRLDQSPQEAILSATLDANHQIHNRGLASPDFRGMGTTATALVLLPSGALAAHVGDSRAYRVRAGRIEQLTFDHSLVWEIRAAGQAPDAELPAFVSKNIITRSLGPNPAVKVDLEGPFATEVGDKFLLCSDGLCGQISDEEIGMVLESLSPADAVRALVDLANLRGGPDNITAVVAHVLGPQVAQTTVSDTAAESPLRGDRVVHLLVWAILGIGLAAAGGLLASGYPLIALFMVLAATIAAVTATMVRSAASADGFLSDSRHFGRGPYVSCNCLPSAEFLARLAEINQQLHDSAVEEKWPADWLPFERLLVDADSAKQLGNVTGAVRAELQAMSCIMAQLRQLRDAAIEGDA